MNTTEYYVIQSAAAFHQNNMSTDNEFGLLHSAFFRYWHWLLVNEAIKISGNEFY